MVRSVLRSGVKYLQLTLVYEMYSLGRQEYMNTVKIPFNEVVRPLDAPYVVAKLQKQISQNSCFGLVVSRLSISSLSKGA